MTKIFCKENYKFVIAMINLFYKSIVLKIFMVDTLLNIGYSLES